MTPTKRRLALIAALAACALALSLTFRPVQGFLLSLYLPSFPDWPEPVRTLSADSTGEIHFATASPFDLDVIIAGRWDATPTTGLGYLTVPESASAGERVPAMVILPGSGGISPGREREYADLLARHGVASLVIEYYLPRGLTTDTPYIVRTASVTEFDVVTDAYAALALLSTSPRIDPDRIGLMGFSYGGMATRFAMDERIREALAPDASGFALHVDFYGPCFQELPGERVRRVPLLTLRGTDDASNDLEACSRREQELKRLGVPVEAHVFPRAGHAWEISAPRHQNEFPYLAGCEVSYDVAGFSTLRGERISNVEPGEGRFERIAARITSGGAYRECLKYGYVVGRDDEARAKGYRILLEFLQRQLGTRPSSGPNRP